MYDVTRFAGYRSPEALMKDPWLTRDDKIGGLRTWRRLITRLGTFERERDGRASLLGEIDRALERMTEA